MVLCTEAAQSTHLRLLTCLTPSNGKAGAGEVSGRLLTCAKDNLVVVAFSNSAFLDMLLNWLVALHRVGIAQYLVVAMDEPVCCVYIGVTTGPQTD